MSTFGSAYRGKRVLVTGHTGFKGGWLTAWLQRLGAHVVGFALPAESGDTLFRSIDVASLCEHREGDVRDREALSKAIEQARPDIVFHLAAQPLVRLSYEDPLGTLSTNVMGTAHLLESVRQRGAPCSVVVVTSDKCYENHEWAYGYRESDAMGGHDVYSMSKGACELVVASWRRSFFADGDIAVATARAGNVIGGGDWAKDRIIPDAIRALLRNDAVPVRNPHAVRPWQHVLEPLSGYIVLGARLMAGDASAREAWNFGPAVDEARNVAEMMTTFVGLWGQGAAWQDVSGGAAPHEAGLLRLAIDKAVAKLGWKPRWKLTEALRHTIEWYKLHAAGDSARLKELTITQIEEYERSMAGATGDG